MSTSSIRFARNAVIGLALVTLGPIAAIGVRTNRGMVVTDNSIGMRVAALTPLRELMLPVDAEITPADAGRSFDALWPATEAGTPDEASDQAAVLWPWRQNKPSKNMFEARLPGFDGPASKYVITDYSLKNTPQQLAWLRMVAEAPVWRDFDRVARAREVDMIGGWAEFPFTAETWAPSLPIRSYEQYKELASAAMSRVAYYAAIGDLRGAEDAANAVLSVGFHLIDNGTHAIDALGGRLFVETGRDGIEQLGQVSHFIDPMYELRFVQRPEGTSFELRIDTLSRAAYRLTAVARSSDESLTRGERFESLAQLSYSTCGNLREALFGPKPDVRATFAAAKKTLARSASDQAYLDLLLDATNRAPNSRMETSVGQSLIDGAAMVGSMVTRNPRIAACARISSME